MGIVTPIELARSLSTWPWTPWTPIQIDPFEAKTAPINSTPLTQTSHSGLEFWPLTPISDLSFWAQNYPFSDPLWTTTIPIAALWLAFWAKSARPWCSYDGWIGLFLSFRWVTKVNVKIFFKNFYYQWKFSIKFSLKIDENWVNFHQYGPPERGSVDPKDLQRVLWVYSLGPWGPRDLPHGHSPWGLSPWTYGSMEIPPLTMVKGGIGELFKGLLKSSDNH